MSKETVQSALQKRAEQVATASEMMVAKIRDVQVIQQYLKGKLQAPLSEEQQSKLDRYQFMYNQLVSGKYTEQEVLQMVIRIYKIGLPQAYEDKNATQEIFSSVVCINKRFELKTELEINRNMRRKYEDIGDSKAAVACGKLIKDILKDLEEPEDDGNADLWEGITNEAVFDPALLGAPEVDFKQVLAVINEKRHAKISMEQFEVIDHEEVPDENS